MVYGEKFPKSVRHRPKSPKNSVAVPVGVGVRSRRVCQRGALLERLHPVNRAQHRIARTNQHPSWAPSMAYPTPTARMGWNRAFIKIKINAEKRSKNVKVAVACLCDQDDLLDRLDVHERRLREYTCARA